MINCGKVKNNFKKNIWLISCCLYLILLSFAAAAFFRLPDWATTSSRAADTNPRNSRLQVTDHNAIIFNQGGPDQFAGSPIHNQNITLLQTSEPTSSVGSLNNYGKLDELGKNQNGKDKR